MASNPSKKELARRRAQSVSEKQLLLSGQQAETLIGIPYRSIYDLHVRGLLPGVRFEGGRRLWFRRADIDRLITNSLTSPDVFAGTK